MPLVDLPTGKFVRNGIFKTKTPGVFREAQTPGAMPPRNPNDKGEFRMKSDDPVYLNRSRVRRNCPAPKPVLRTTRILRNMMMRATARYNPEANRHARMYPTPDGREQTSRVRVKVMLDLCDYLVTVLTQTTLRPRIPLRARLKLLSVAERKWKALLTTITERIQPRRGHRTQLRLHESKKIYPEIGKLLITGAMTIPCVEERKETTQKAGRTNRGTQVMIVLGKHIISGPRLGALRVGATVIEGRRKIGNGRVTDATEAGEKPANLNIVTKIGPYVSSSIAGTVVTASVLAEIGNRKVVVDLESMKGIGQRRHWIEEQGLEMSVRALSPETRCYQAREDALCDSLESMPFV